MPVVRKQIEETRGGNALFAPASHSRSRAAAAASLGLEMLRRGETLINIFKQDKNHPLSVFDEVVLLLAYNENCFENVPARNMRGAIQKLLAVTGRTCPVMNSARERYTSASATSSGVPCRPSGVS